MSDPPDDLYDLEAQHYLDSVERIALALERLLALYTGLAGVIVAETDAERQEARTLLRATLEGLRT